MRKSHHLRLYDLLGKLLQGFLILVYSFFIVCLLLIIATDMDVGWRFLTFGWPWLLKLGLAFGCSIGILSLFEVLS